MWTPSPSRPIHMTRYHRVPVSGGILEKQVIEFLVLTF
jgi:hypothetical protein